MVCSSGFSKQRPPASVSSVGPIVVHFLMATQFTASQFILSTFVCPISFQNFLLDMQAVAHHTAFLLIKYCFPGLSPKLSKSSPHQAVTIWSKDPFTLLKEEKSVLSYLFEECSSVTVCNPSSFKFRKTAIYFLFHSSVRKISFLKFGGVQDTICICLFPLRQVDILALLVLFRLEIPFLPQKMGKVEKHSPILLIPYHTGNNPS